tara:strand:+ start:4301 stop:5086 length:786 start_codon:yes stop_codon:yes gene_type:complete
MKRLIFTLYFNGINFCLSRNFKLQSVGDVNWLHDNYGFGSTSNYIDELVILDVCRTRTPESRKNFTEAVVQLTRDIFIPISLGGGIRTLEDAKKMFDIGADKVVVNSSCFQNPDLLKEISQVYGSQSLICSLDVLLTQDGIYSIQVDSGVKTIGSLDSVDFRYVSQIAGEIMIHSIDRDGTGDGYANEIAEILSTKFLTNQIIFSGGAGKPSHFNTLFKAYPWISAAATGNLFNFLGTGLKDARMSLISDGIDLPDFETWE